MAQKRLRSPKRRETALESISAERDKVWRACLSLIAGDSIDDPFLAMSHRVEEVISALRLRSIRDEDRGIRDAERQQDPRVEPLRSAVLYLLELYDRQVHNSHCEGWTNADSLRIAEIRKLVK